MTSLVCDTRLLVRSVWLACLVATPLGLIGALSALDALSVSLREHSPHLVWTSLLLWALLAIGTLHGARGLAWCLACAVVAVPLGLLPWVGLGALVLVSAALPLALVGIVLLLVARTRKVGATLASGATGMALFGLLALSAATACGPLPSVDGTTAAAQLASLARSDQRDRQSACFVFNPSRDIARRALAKELLARGERFPPQALADAGLILLHGSEVADLELAHSLLLSAVALGHADAKPLERVALDRLHLSRGQPQVYGTQWIVVK